MGPGLIGLTARIERLATVLAILCLVLGCDQTAEPSESQEDGASAGQVDENRNGPARSTIEGDWWVLCADLPHQAFKLSLLAGDANTDFWEGSWIVFDWRGTVHPGALARASAAVSVSAHRSAGGTIIISGPVPQVDAQGLPTGETGAWELTVQQISLAGQPLRYGGSMRHSDDAGGEPALNVELETGFRAWAR